MPPAFATGTRVQVQQGMLAVIHSLQNMGMSGDEHGWFFLLDSSFRQCGIFTGIAANVDHQNFSIFTPETKCFRKCLTYFSIIDVSENALQRLPSGQLLRHTNTEIAAMPDLVCLICVAQDALVQVAVGIREEEDVGHGF